MLGRHIATLCIYLFVSTSVTAADPVYLEDNGLVVIEAERALLMCTEPDKNPFEIRTELPGFTGPGYLYWNGGNRYGGVGSEILRYRIFINKPGRYELTMHVSSKGAERHDYNNDCWLKMDDGKWYKTFQSSTEGWRWGGRFDHHADGKPVAHYELSAGEHILYLSGRSQGFHIDRIHLYLPDRAKDAKLTDLAETNNLPEPPASLINKQIRDAWFAGQMGAIWSWAEKEREKDQVAASLLPILEKNFAEQIQAVHDEFERQPVIAYQQFQIVTEHWGNGPKSCKKILKDLQKTWSKDKQLKQELKAQAVVKKLIALRQDTSTDQAHTIAQGEALLEKKFGDTKIVQQYLAQYR